MDLPIKCVSKDTGHGISEGEHDLSVCCFSSICGTPMVSFFIEWRKWSNLTKRKSNLWRKWSSLTKGSGNGLIRGSRCALPSQASSSPSLLTQIVPDESLPSHRGFFPPNNQHSEQLPVWRKRGEVYREWLFSRLSIRIFKSFCFLTGRTSVSLETRIKGIKCWVPIAQGRGVPHVTLDKRLTGAGTKSAK